MLALAHLVQGKIYHYTGNVTGAIQSLKKALELDSLDDDARNELALTYENAGQLLQAESLLKEGLNHNHASWVNYDFVGAFYYRHQQYQQAEPLFRAAMDLAPDNPVAFSNLAGMYTRQGKCKEAEPILVHAVSIAASASTYSNLGTVYFCLGDYSKSAAMFQKATELRPLDHRLWINLGDAYNSAGNRTQATQAYTKAIGLAEKALAINPLNAELLGDAALYYAKLGDRAKAERMLGKAPRSALQNQDFKLLLAETLEKLGNRDRALAAIRELLQAGYPPNEIENDFELAQLRKDRHYQEMVRNQFPAESALKSN
jgi:tetratricopeptide (TPR) repeat protein